MAVTYEQEARRRLFDTLAPQLKQLCENAPQFGSIRLEAYLSDYECGRVSLGADISRKIAPRADRGTR